MRRWAVLALALLVALILRPAAPAAQEVEAEEAAEAEEQPLEVQADSVEHDPIHNVYVGRGNVRILRSDQTLTADWVSFNPDTRRGVAAGNVVIVEAGDTLIADFLQFDIDNMEGVVFQGRVDSPDSAFQLAGEEVRKTGPKTYIFYEGEFTTCRCPDGGKEPWKIRANRADVEVEGYGTARNTTFEILGVPVFWLPWMIYPLKSERQSGFLFPNFFISDRSGFDVGLPFFWAARDNLNVVLTPRYLTDRGFKMEFDSEYVFGERSWGEIFAAYLPDDEEINPNDAATPFDTDRWGARWVHDQFLPWDWRFKADTVFVSDNQYTFDFQDLRQFRDDRYIQSVAFLSRALGSQGWAGLVGSVWWADDQQNPDDQDRDDFLLQRLPQLNFTGVAKPSFSIAGVPLVPSFDVDYTHFWREKDPQDVYPSATVVGDDIFLDTGIEAIPDGHERNSSGNIVTLEGDVILSDGTVLTAAEVMEGLPEGAMLPSPDGSRDNFPPGPEFDGEWEDGEPLGDKGHRLTLNPRLALPFRLGEFLEIYPEAAYHGTFYQTSAQSFESRNLFTGQVDLTTRLRREFKMPFSEFDSIHVLEPHLAWTGITSASQSDKPLFVPRGGVPQDRIRQLELYNVTRDPSDRIASMNALTLSLENRVYVQREPEAPRQLFADFVLSTQYRMNQDGFEHLFFDGTFFPARGWRARTVMGWDFNESNLSESYFSVGWRSEAGHDLRVSYRYLRNPPRFFENFQFEDRFDEFQQTFQEVSQFDLLMRWAISAKWALTYRLRYSFEDEIFLNNGGGIEYISGCRCWALRLEIDNDRTGGIEFGVQYTVIGLGDDEDAVRPFSGGGRSLFDPMGR